MKNQITALFVALAMLVVSQACSGETTTASENILSSTDEFVQTENASITAETLSTFSLNEISSEENAGLIFMREEEKVARDVYLTMYENYGLRVFKNISSSEQTHMNAIKLLLDRYKLEDPVGENSVGTFTDPDLQALFEQLIVTANVSEIEALKVGAAIEEIDILDLVTHIEELVDNADIEFVYNNLKRGSENHLKAFVRNLSVRGVAYVPQYLDLETYNSIIN